jgi:gliding motility-associated-like protein
MKKLNFKFMTYNLRLIISLTLGLIPAISFSQLTLTATSTPNYVCNGNDCEYSGPTILINEIQIAPTNYDGSIWGKNCSDRCGEWIELYNPHKCEPVDISYYFMGNHSYEDPDKKGFSGGLLIPEGTVIPSRGFCLIRGVNAPAVDPKYLVKNGGRTVEIVVDSISVKTCIGSGASRLWFPNDGGWFAFYDRNGVPQDAISWGKAAYSCTYCNPCTPPSPYFSGVLPSYDDISFGRKTRLGNGSVGVNKSANTYKRYRDGESWYSVAHTATMGYCNFACIEAPLTSCNGTATVSVTGGTPPYTFKWDDSELQTTSTAEGLCARIYTVTVTDKNNLTATATVEVSAYVPEIKLPAHDPVCLNTPAFEWQGITPTGGFFSGAGIDNMTFDPAVAEVGTHELTYIYVDNHDCLNSVKTSITVNPLPVLEQPADVSLCAGDTFSFSAFTGTYMSTFNWAVTAGTGASIGMPENGTDSIPAFVAMNNGSSPVTVPITVTPKSPAGCMGIPKTFTITVNPSPVLPPISDIALCTGLTTQSVSFTGTNVNAATSTWEVISGSGTAIGMSAENGTDNIPAFKAVNSDTVDISVTISVTPKSANGCAGTPETFTVTVYHKVDIAVYLGNDTMICRADTLLLNAGHPFADSYQWQDNSKGMTYTVYRKEGQFWVIVSSQCNKAGDTINITHYKDLQIDLGKDIAFCEDDIVYQELKVKVNMSNVLYRWQNGSELPTYIAEQPGIYSVTVSNICMSVWDEIEVKIVDCSVLEIWAPNAFTPDENGMNDVFKLEVNNPELLKEYEMIIYDRWGNPVFITQDYLSGWNGKNFKGKECSMGVYTGMIKYKDVKNHEFIKRISITLLR